MIKGIELINENLRKPVMTCISEKFDLSDDVEVEEIDTDIISINDLKFYVLTYKDEEYLISEYNQILFEEYFSNLDSLQLGYIDKDLWYDERGISSFEEWIAENTDYTVKDSFSFEGYNFYEIC